MTAAASKQQQTFGKIGLAGAAELLQLTPRRVQQLVGDGWIQKGQRKGDYTVAAVVQGYIKFLQDEGRRTSRSASSSRVADARTQEIELRIAERSGSLVEAARTEAIAVVDDVIGHLRADLIGVPARVTADLETRRKIEASLDDVLRAASKRATDTAARIDAGGGPADAGEEDDA